MKHNSRVGEISRWRTFISDDFTSWANIVELRHRKITPLRL